MSKIRFEQVSFAYDNLWDGDSEYALKDINFHMEQGEYIAIIGKTGSGKSTLLQHLNGLLKPSQGHVYYDDADIHDKNYEIKNVRQKVALCFQYPEYQLFEESVMEDICFGPKNMGLDDEECKRRARVAMEMLNLPENLEDISPFSLSGGQKRRVALAGILAMEPDFLILDEPVAGMDQRGKNNLFAILKRLNQLNKVGIVLVSHDMDDVAANADRVIAMHQGKIVLDDSSRNVFRQKDKLLEIGMDLPYVVSTYHQLVEAGVGEEIEEIPLNMEELSHYIAHSLNTSHRKEGEKA